MKLNFCGANRQVTGSCYLLEAAGKRILIDCGLYQERCCLERNWNPFPFEPDTLDFVLLTHGHLDHSGLLPRLHREGFAGPILATRPTEDLTRIVLEDSARIQEEDIEQKRRRHERQGRSSPYPLVPLYSRADVGRCMSAFQPVDYDKPKTLAPGLEIRYRDSGHILGSAIIEVHAVEDGRSASVAFSGDLGPWDAPLVENPAKVPEADFIVMESTYGDREHKDEGPVEDRLAEIVTETISRGGNLIIPTFAIDRAQDLLYYFSRLANENRTPRVGIYLDSPMAIGVTRIYKEYAYLLDNPTRELLKRNEHPFQFRGLHFVRSPEESRRLNSMKGPKVILAGSGMCTGGRIKHHLRQYIEDKRNTLLFVGYQAADTLGRKILDGAKEVRIHATQYRVNARIERLFGLSAHADRVDLMRWLGYFRNPPRHLFLTHGEENAANQLAEQVRSELKWTTTVPSYRDGVELVTD